MLGRWCASPAITETANRPSASRPRFPDATYDPTVGVDAATRLANWAAPYEPTPRKRLEGWCEWLCWRGENTFWGSVCVCLLILLQRTGLVRRGWLTAASRSARRQGGMGALVRMRSRARVCPVHNPARTNSANGISLAGAPAARWRLECCASLGTRGWLSIPCSGQLDVRDG